MTDLFSNSLNNCTSAYLDPAFSSAKKQMLAEHQILFNFYQEYKKYRDMIINQLILK